MTANFPAFTAVMLALLVALTVSGQAAEPTRKDLKAIQERLVTLGTRLAAIKKHEKTKDVRRDEATWQSQDAQVEGIKREFNSLYQELKKLGGQLPPQGSPLGVPYGQLSQAMDAFSEWHATKTSWLFAGQGNPSLKVLEANEARTYESFCRLRDQAATSLK